MTCCFFQTSASIINLESTCRKMVLIIDNKKSEFQPSVVWAIPYYVVTVTRVICNIYHSNHWALRWGVKISGAFTSSLHLK